MMFTEKQKEALLRDTCKNGYLQKDYDTLSTYYPPHTIKAMEIETMCDNFGSEEEEVLLEWR